MKDKTNIFNDSIIFLTTDSQIFTDDYVGKRGRFWPKPFIALYKKSGLKPAPIDIFRNNKKYFYYSFYILIIMFLSASQRILSAIPVRFADEVPSGFRSGNKPA